MTPTLPTIVKSAARFMAALEIAVDRPALSNTPSDVEAPLMAEAVAQKQENLMLAFHGDPAVKAKYLHRVEVHAAADEIIHGRYWGERKEGLCGRLHGPQLAVSHGVRV